MSSWASPQVYCLSLPACLLHARIACARAALIPWLRWAKLGVASAETASPSTRAARALLNWVMFSSLSFFFTRIFPRVGARPISWCDPSRLISPESEGRSIVPWNGPYHSRETLSRTCRFHAEPTATSVLCRTDVCCRAALPMEPDGKVSVEHAASEGHAQLARAIGAGALTQCSVSDALSRRSRRLKRAFASSLLNRRPNSVT